MSDTSSVLLILLLSISLVAGCASNHYGTQQTQVHYYAQCYDPIKKLRESENSGTQGATTGAFVGALGGALLGFALTGKAGGAAAGAVSGGLIGGAVGYQLAQSRQIADDNRRMAAYLQDLDGNISHLDIASASARTALQCYDRQFKMLILAIRHRRVSYGEAQQMFSEIQAGTKEAAAILGTLEHNASDMERQYRAALASEEETFQWKKTTPQARGQLVHVKKRCDTLQTNVTKVRTQRADADKQLKAQQDELSAVLASSQA